MNRAMLQDRRTVLLGGAIAAIVLVAASWFLLISPTLGSADDLRSQNADAQTQNAIIAGKNGKLAAQNRQIASVKAKLASALAGLPPVTALPAFTLQVTSAARADKVTLTSVSFGEPTVPVAPTTDPSASPSASPSPSVSSGSAAGSASSNTITVAVTLTSTGSLAAQTAFLDDVQKGPRRVLVTATQLSTANGSNSSTATTMTTSLTIFSAPMSPDQLKVVKRDLASD